MLFATLHIFPLSGIFSHRVNTAAGFSPADAYFVLLLAVLSLGAGGDPRRGLPLYPHTGQTTAQLLTVNLAAGGD